jgi:hypothetical protein
VAKVEERRPPGACRGVWWRDAPEEENREEEELVRG